MAIVFAVNAIGCLAIVGLTACKRIDVERRTTMLRHRIASLRHSQTLVDRAALAEARSARCGRDCAPSARHRDNMILLGLMS